MTSYYVDTSALAKYYIAETGTNWVRSILRPSVGNITVLCETTPLASAVHATNILGEPLTFVSGDIDLLNAASGKGFAVDNPNAHP